MAIQFEIDFNYLYIYYCMIKSDQSEKEIQNQQKQYSYEEMARQLQEEEMIFHQINQADIQIKPILEELFKMHAKNAQKGSESSINKLKSFKRYNSVEYINNDVEKRTNMNYKYSRMTNDKQSDCLISIPQNASEYKKQDEQINSTLLQENKREQNRCNNHINNTQKILSHSSNIVNSTQAFKCSVKRANSDDINNYAGHNIQIKAKKTDLSIQLNQIEEQEVQNEQNLQNQHTNKNKNSLKNNFKLLELADNQETNYIILNSRVKRPLAEQQKQKQQKQKKTEQHISKGNISTTPSREKKINQKKQKSYQMQQLLLQKVTSLQKMVKSFQSSYNSKGYHDHKHQNIKLISRYNSTAHLQRQVLKSNTYQSPKKTQNIRLKFLQGSQLESSQMKKDIKNVYNLQQFKMIKDQMNFKHKIEHNLSLHWKQLYKKYKHYPIYEIFSQKWTSDEMQDLAMNTIWNQISNIHNFNAVQMNSFIKVILRILFPRTYKFMLFEIKKLGTQIIVIINFINQQSILMINQQTYNIYIGTSINQAHFKVIKHGFGITIQPQKYLYIGQFHKDLENGFGRIIDLSGKYFYDGFWYNGHFQGKGYLQIFDNSKFYGNFVNDKKRGYGYEQLYNGDFYEGQYFQNKFQGIGTYLWKIGSYYTGQFKKGYRSGKGKWISSTGDIYYGNFKQNVKDGLGIFKAQGKNSYIGYYVQGKLHQKLNSGQFDESILVDKNFKKKEDRNLIKR